MNNTGSTAWAALGDTELAQAIQRGEEAAFEELVRRYQGRVYATAYRVTGNREDALDVAQEALLKAWRKIGRWQPTGPFLAWLLRLTSNQAIDHLRRGRRNQHVPLDEAFVPGMEDTPAAPATTAETVRAREIDGVVRAALKVLSPAQRTVFMLRHYEGFQLADIAEEMGCTVGSVKVHLFRALKKLRVELRDFHEEGGTDEA